MTQKAHEKHPIHGTPFSCPRLQHTKLQVSLTGCTVNSLSKDKSPVSEGEEHHVKNENEIGESHKSQLKFEYEVYLLHHGLRGSASPVLTATGFVNGRWQFSTPHRIHTP